MHFGPEHYLDKDSAASRVMAHARLLLKLTRRFESIAPAGLGRGARVANFKAGKLVVHADNGAVAAKLRQLSQRLCNELSSGGLECHSLEVKVQPRHWLDESEAPSPKPISAKAAGILAATSRGLPAGPLRDALDSLLERAAKRG